MVMISRVVRTQDRRYGYTSPFAGSQGRRGTWKGRGNPEARRQLRVSSSNNSIAQLVGSERERWLRRLSAGLTVSNKVITNDLL